jgi:hypothetical protein
MTSTVHKKAPGAAAGPAKSPRRSAAEWATIVAEWKRSGLTAEAFAEERGLAASTLAWWSSQGLRRSAVASRSGGTRPACPPRAAHGPAFVPLHIVRPPAPAAASAPGLRAEVVLAGGRRVRLRGELTLAEFIRLVDALEGGASC